MRTAILAVFAVLAFTLSVNGADGQHIARGVKVIVVDAGHGGPNFPGAHYRGVYEKDLNLKVALRLGALIEKEMPGVKVVYTRKTDRQLAPTLNEDLQARADIANGAGGDLFISIHANAAPSASARGVETLIMGESPRETKANEEVLFANNREEFLDMADEKTAAIVRAYIQNLQFTYGEYSLAMARCIQKRYGDAGRRSRGVKHQPLKVLYATDMPGVLTEIGFMSNPSEFAYMNSEKGQREIARAIFGAVKDYDAYVRGTQQADEAPAASEPVVSEPVAPEPAAAKPAASKPDGGLPAAADSAADAPKPETPIGKKSTPAAKETPAEKKSAPVKEVRQPERGYTIQVMASGKAVSPSSSEFKSYRGKVERYTSTGRFRYKYCVGRYAGRAAAVAELRTVRKSFPAAFVVKYEGEKIVQ